MEHTSDKKTKTRSLFANIFYSVCFLLVAAFFIWIILGLKLECSCGNKSYFNFYTSPYDNGVYICEDCAFQKYAELPEDKKVNFLVQWH